MHIEAKVRIGAAQRTASPNRNLTGIQVSRVREKLADWHPRLKVDAWAEVEATEPTAIFCLAA